MNDFYTPAPLDPNAVEAGDTVTLTRRSAKFEGTVDDIAHERTDGEVTVLAFGFYDMQGWFDVAKAADPWTLTDHQHAPKPEWMPGTVGTAAVLREGKNGGDKVFRKTLGMVVHRPAPIDDWMFVTVEGDMWGLEGDYCKGFVPDEPRPLPTRQQIVDALFKGRALPNTEDRIGMVDAIEALLRGEPR